MFHVLRLGEPDRGALIAAPSDGLAIFCIEDVGSRERTGHHRYNLCGVRDFVEGVPEEPGTALFRVLAGDLLGTSYLHYFHDDRQEAPWERPWWDRLAADPRPVFVIVPEWEVYTTPDKTRTPPPMPLDGVEFKDHYAAMGL